MRGFRDYAIILASAMIALCLDDVYIHGEYVPKKEIVNCEFVGGKKYDRTREYVFFPEVSKRRLGVESLLMGCGALALGFEMIRGKS